MAGLVFDSNFRHTILVIGFDQGTTHSSFQCKQYLVGSTKGCFCGLIIALIIIASVDNPNSDASSKKLKANLGFFLMFIILSGGLVYLLFGFGAS